jgi:hypothetical protein
MHVPLEPVDHLANTGNPARTRERGGCIALEDRLAQDRAPVVHEDVDRAGMRHGTPEAGANALRDHDIGDVTRRWMDDTLGEAMNAMLRVADRFADQLALDTLGALHGLLDARSASSAAHRIEEVHEACTDQHAPGETRKLRHVASASELPQHPRHALVESFS